MRNMEPGNPHSSVLTVSKVFLKSLICHQIALRVLSILTIILIVLGTLYIYNNLTYEQQNLVPFTTKTNASKEKVPLVLAWTKYYGNPFANNFRYWMRNCSYKCNYTDDRKQLSNADAVAFHVRDLSAYDLPPIRLSNQYFVFFLDESPAYTYGGLRNVPTDYFNITMTYRNDSTVFTPYNDLVKIDTYNKLPQIWHLTKLKEKLDKKTKMVLQFVSHCSTDSKREIYIAELKKHIDVLQIGQCGCKRCNKMCEKKAIDEHLFYLSFENSVCDDYITEKFFDRVGEFLPVVLKRSILEPFYPKDAFVAADDFDTPVELANYLKYLANNRTALMKHFEWLESYSWRETGTCRLCALLHKNPRKQYMIRHVKKWWFQEAKCYFAYAERLL